MVDGEENRPDKATRSLVAAYKHSSKSRMKTVLGCFICHGERMLSRGDQGLKDPVTT